MFESVTCSSAVKSDLCLCTDRSYYCGVVYSWIITTWVCDKACVRISCVVACLVHAAHSRPQTENKMHPTLSVMCVMIMVSLQQWERLHCVVWDEVKLLPTRRQQG